MIGWVTMKLSHLMYPCGTCSRSVRQYDTSTAPSPSPILNGCMLSAKWFDISDKDIMHHVFDDEPMADYWQTTKCDTWPLHCGPKQPDLLELIIHFAMSSGVSERVSEQTNERSKWYEASKWVSSASEQANWRKCPRFLFILDHSAPDSCLF